MKNQASELCGYGVNDGLGDSGYMRAMVRERRGFILAKLAPREKHKQIVSRLVAGGGRASWLWSEFAFPVSEGTC